MSSPDCAILGGGIVGLAAACTLADRGASVQLFEADRIASGASGRNAGVIQHPLDPALDALHARTLAIYRDLLSLPEHPQGLLVLAHEERRAELESVAGVIRAGLPELSPEFLEPEDARHTEPLLGEGICACRVQTGWPVQPAAATHALAQRARDLGVLIQEGRPATLSVAGGRVLGVRIADEGVACGGVLIAAGHATPTVVEPAGVWCPIAPVWGVNVEVELAQPPQHVLEEAGMPALAGEHQSAIEGLVAQGQLFSAAHFDGRVSLGSTFTRDAPDPAGAIPALRARGATYLPDLRHATAGKARACARPQSPDGRPLLGPVRGVDRLFIATGHGPWGVSIGPASAEHVANSMLDPNFELPGEFDALRFQAAMHTGSDVRD